MKKYMTKRNIASVIIILAGCLAFLGENGIEYYHQLSDLTFTQFAGLLSVIIGLATNWDKEGGE